MIWRDTFPYRSHRTFAEVAETERLRQRARHEDLHMNARARWHALEARACQPERGPPPAAA